MTVELIQGLLMAFALVVILMPSYIRLLQAVGFGKRIREEGPESHYAKEGTPTMGGLLIILVVLGIFLLLRWPVQGGVIAPIATLALVGLLGAVDDYLNARTGEGIKVRQKLLWQTVVALFVAWQIQSTYQITGIRVPFVGDVFVEPWLYVAFGTFAIVAASNGVNITDGLDGLSGGTLAFAFVSFMIIALLNVPAQPNIAFFSAIRNGEITVLMETVARALRKDPAGLIAAEERLMARLGKTPRNLPPPGVDPPERSLGVLRGYSN